MNSGHVQWIHRKLGSDDVYYNRKTRQIIRGRDSINRYTDEQIFSLTTYNPEAPIKVYFDPSYYCNLTCRHCITDSSNRIDREQEMQTGRIISIVDELTSSGVLELMVAGGEPLCHPDIYSILKHMTAQELNVILDTNGTLVKPDTATRLSDLGLSEIRLSFDGGQHFHDSIRGPGNYQRALKALTLLSANGLQVVPRLTLCRGSESGLDQLFKDLSRSGVKVIKCSNIKNAGRAALPENQDLIEDTMNLATVTQIRELAKKYSLEVMFSIYFPVIPGEVDGGDLRHGNCGAGIVTGYISPSGNVQPCSSMPRNIFGNLLNMSFIQAWTSDIAEEYRRSAHTCGSFQLCALRNN